jgi:hypothetical protein
LAIKGFELLSAHLFHWPSTITRDDPTDLSIGRLRSKKDVYTQLHSSLLPLLKQYFNSVAEALHDSTELRKDPAPKIQRVLEIQPYLHRTLDQMIRIIDDIIPGKVPEPSQTNDQHFEHFKCYRLYGLKDCIRGDLYCQMVDCLYVSCIIIEELKLPATKRSPRPMCSQSSLNAAFDTTLKWLDGSELHIIPDLWKESIEDNFGAKSAYFDRSDPPSDPPTSQAAIQLARSIFAIIKLSKLFFVKLSRKPVKGKPVPLFTEMSSQQLYSLQKSPEEYGYSVMDLVSHLGGADLHPPTCLSLIQDIQVLSNDLQSVVPLVALYIAPLFPDINGVSAQIYFKTWLITWNTLFFTATYNAIQAVNAFAQNHHL